MLVIQIALGIVLALFIIAFLPELLSIGLIVFLIIVAVFVSIAIIAITYNYISLESFIIIIMSLALFFLVHKIVELAEKSNIKWIMIFKIITQLSLIAFITLVSILMFLDGHIVGAILLPVFFVYPFMCWFLSKYLGNKYPKMMFGDIFVALVLPGVMLLAYIAYRWS